MTIKEITKNNFEQEVLQEKLPAVVDFWAPWCGYCKRLSPALDQVAKDYGENLVVGKINIDEQPELMEQFSVETIPTLILFREGKAIDSIIAPESRAQVTEWLRKNAVE